MRKGQGIGGAVLAIAGFGEHFVGTIEALDFAKEKWPHLYALITSPTTGTAMIIAGVVIVIDAAVRKSRTPKTHTPLPPVDIGTWNAPAITASPAAQVAGRDIIINQIPAQPAPPASPALVRPVPMAEQSRPVLVHRGIIDTRFDLPYYDESIRRWARVSIPCQALGIRNDADSSKGLADNVVAHLDFESDAFGRVSVDEGWWVEDAEDTAHYYFSIPRSQTKYLVLVAQSASGECLVVPKRWDKGSYRHVVADSNGPLRPGKWRLRLEITSENVRNRFHTQGIVDPDGSSAWSVPVTEQPADWPQATG